MFMLNQLRIKNVALIFFGFPIVVKLLRITGCVFPVIKRSKAGETHLPHKDVTKSAKKG
jgi:hypothetical protein